MINSKYIQSAYVDLYTQLRKYIWGFDTVEKIAELEIAAYKSFPDKTTLSNRLSGLKLDIKDISKDDEDLHKAIVAFEELLESDDSVYSTLNQVNEVISK